MAASTERTPDSDEGFGLVELVVAMLLLLVIAIAILPALINGIRYSAEQSTVATATRHLNTMVEQLRQTTTTCDELYGHAGDTEFALDAVRDATATTQVVSCQAEDTGHVVITATEGTQTLATVDALIFISPAATP